LDDEVVEGFLLLVSGEDEIFLDVVLDVEAVNLSAFVMFGGFQDLYSLDISDSFDFGIFFLDFGQKIGEFFMMQVFLFFFCHKNYLFVYFFVDRLGIGLVLLCEHTMIFGVFIERTIGRRIGVVKKRRRGVFLA
jgi:hypothetical protein